MKKGFTLIELLAVIVILGIIALIATPIVLNIIGDMKNDATTKSAQLYLKAAEQAIMSKKQEVRGFMPTKCDIQGDGNLFCNKKVLVEIDINGEKPNGGIINFQDGKVKSMELSYKTVLVRQDSKGMITQDKIDYEVVYFDVVAGKSCVDYHNENSKTGYNGIDNKTYGQTSCLKFYLINEENGKVDLILDHNTTAVKQWYAGSDNRQGPQTAINQLKIDTQDWNGTVTPNNVTVNLTDNDYTINYSGFKARLISAQEVSKIVGYKDWKNEIIKKGDSLNENGNWYFFNTKTTEESSKCQDGNTSGCVYRWLYDRTGLDCETKGCLNNSDVQTKGFWTDTAVVRSVIAGTYNSCNGYVAYGVTHNGRLGAACVSKVDQYGIRPVITVSKANLN